MAVSARALMGVLATSFPAFKQLAADLTAAVQDPNSVLKKDAQAATATLRQFVAAVARTASIAEAAQRMDHLRTGSPTEVIKVEHEMMEVDTEAVAAEAKALLAELAESDGDVAAAAQLEIAKAKGALLS